MIDRLSAVVFDIGNVLVEWNPRFLYEQLIPDPDELTYFLENVVTLSWHTEHDRGRPFAEGVRILTEKFPHYADLIAAFDTRWNETIRGPVRDTVLLLERLAEHGTWVYGLTNFSTEKWPSFCRAFLFTDIFDGVVVSGQEGLVKPDPRIYQVAIQRFGLDPERTFYVDDRQENVDAANALGLRGHLFTGAGALERDLKAEGFL